ncbi:MAG: response regulator, partial [Burkholderiales bacterium]|nr:response regulator [Burkholderiales bacterium]
MNTLEVFQKALRELSGRYARELPQKLAEIEAIWESAREGPHSREALAALRRLVHGLDASSSMLGVPALSTPSRTLVRRLDELLLRPSTPKDIDIEGVETLLADLHRAAQPQVVATRFDRIASSHPRYIREDDQRRVFLLEQDDQTAANLVSQLERFGYEVRNFSDPEQLAEAIAEHPPYALVVDAALAGGGLSAGLARIGRDAPDRPPIVFLSSRSDVHSRLEAVRAGATAYFTKPVRVTDLVDKLDQLSTWDAPEPYRVLIVDADHSRAEFCRAVLREAGMDVMVVSRPDDVLGVLNDSNPELLLIALELPGCGGDDIAQVVHQMPTNVSLPVVFLTEHWDLNRQIRLMNQGGDALLPVPVESQQLIATVV